MFRHIGCEKQNWGSFSTKTKAGATSPNGCKLKRGPDCSEKQKKCLFNHQCLPIVAMLGQVFMHSWHIPDNMGSGKCPTCCSQMRSCYAGRVVGQYVEEAPSLRGCGRLAVRAHSVGIEEKMIENVVGRIEKSSLFVGLFILPSFRLSNASKAICVCFGGVGVIQNWRTPHINNSL